MRPFFHCGGAEVPSFLLLHGAHPIENSRGGSRGAFVKEVKRELVTIDNEKRIDWNAIRADYIKGGISQRKLAEKYGVSENTLIKKANAEKWSDQRATAYNKATTRIQQKTAETAADNATLAASIKRKGLLILERLFDAYDVDSTEHRESANGKADIKRIRDLTAAYKDLAGDLMPDTAGDSALLKSLMEMERRHND